MVPQGLTKHSYQGYTCTYQAYNKEQRNGIEESSKKQTIRPDSQTILSLQIYCARARGLSPGTEFTAKVIQSGTEEKRV